MKWLNRILERRSTNQAPGGDSYWRDYQAGRTGPVNDKTAQGVSAAYACVQAISETIATLPLHLYRMEGENRSKATSHPLYKVLHDQANPEQTAMEAREFLQASVLLRGNGYARLVFGYDGQVREMWPLDPDRVQVVRLVNGSLAYDYNREDGTVQRLLEREVLHLRHRLGPDMVMGVSPIQAARGVVELAINELEHGRETFTNGAKLLGVLKVPGKLDPKQKADIKDGWQTNRSGQTPILEHGADYQALSMSLADAQWLETRRFSVEEVARLFRVPPPVIGHLIDSNYSNSVEMARQFVTMGLRRPLTMWEQAISRKCLTEVGRRTYFAEHSVEGLLRGDSKTRAEFYGAGIKDGWLLKSEARSLENLPVVEGIDHGKTEDAEKQPTDT